MSLRRIGTAYGASLLGMFTSLLSNLWLLRAITQEVDKPTFGLFLVVSTWLSYLGLLQIGLDMAAAQRIAEALARGNDSEAARVYRQLVWFNRALAGAFAAAIVGGALLVRHIPLHSGADETILPKIVLLIGFSQVVAILARPTAAALTGTQQLALVNFIRVGSSLATTLLAYLLLRRGGCSLPAGRGCGGSVVRLDEPGLLAPPTLLLGKSPRRQSSCGIWRPVSLWSGCFACGRRSPDRSQL